MFKRFFSKLVKVMQVITGKDESIIAAKIKQAEMKAMVKSEIASNKDIFETLDTDIVVPEKVIDVFKARLLAKYDSDIAKNIYNLIQQDFDTMFRPELAFELIANPNAISDLIDHYAQKYVRIEVDKVSKSDMKNYFKRMKELEIVLTAKVIEDDIDMPIEQSVVQEVPKVLSEPIPIIKSNNSVAKDKSEAIVQAMVNQGMFKPKGNQKVMLAGTIEQIIYESIR